MFSGAWKVKSSRMGPGTPFPMIFLDLDTFQNIFVRFYHFMDAVVICVMQVSCRFSHPLTLLRFPAEVISTVNTTSGTSQWKSLPPYLGNTYPAWIQDPDSRILNPGSWIQDLGPWVQDPGLRTLDSGSWIQDPGFRILESGSWIQDYTTLFHTISD